MPTTPDVNTLFYGDNLDILRRHVADASVDLVYLDPPFNSNATYNVLFKSPTGEQSQSQIEAFGDTWHWTDSAERAFDEVMTGGNSDAAEMLRAMRGFLKENDMMAYLAMMAVRLLELHRVLKPTGSLYLHCDPTASHYLKLLLDAVFGKDRVLSECIWKRTGAHASSKRWAPVHDVLFFASKSPRYTWNRVHQSYEAGYIDAKYRQSDSRGPFQDVSLTGAGTRKGDSGRPWRSFDPTVIGRHWAVPKSFAEVYPGFDALTTQEKLETLDSEGLLYWPRSSEDSFPRIKQYVGAGVLIQDVITDIPAVNSQAQERLGYPTQKPLALLERILQASSNEGDLVLDPFCGCGTTVHAAQKLNRRWIGIDVTHLAVGLIKRRLTDAFPLAKFEVQGVPKDIGAAQALADADKHQFQLWALSLVEAQPFKGGRKGADGGVDGYIYFKPDGRTTEKAVVSVKGGAHVSDTMVKDLITTVEHERAGMGVFVTLAPATKPMIARAAAAGRYKTEWRDYPRVQILTVEELLGGKKPDMPWLDASVFKKAKRETAASGQGELGV